MAAEIQMTPLRVSNPHTKAIRLMLVSRSSRLNPNPLDRWVRTMSPSRISTLHPRALRRSSIASESVLLPAPESPVNQMVNPFWVIFVHPPSFISIYFVRSLQLYSKRVRFGGIFFPPYFRSKRESPAYRWGSARLAAEVWWEPY